MDPILSPKLISKGCQGLANWVNSIKYEYKPSMLAKIWPLECESSSSVNYNKDVFTMTMGYIWGKCQNKSAGSMTWNPSQFSLFKIK